jgi:hypothetical protein
MHDRHPVLRELQKLQREGKVRLYHSDNLNRQLASLSETEEKVYHKLREMVFGKPQQELNLAEHGDLCLLINHMKAGRDYFLTLESKRYDKLSGHRNLEVRFPDEAFLEEIAARTEPAVRKKSRKARRK